MAKVTKADMEYVIENQRREIVELTSELATATAARDNLFRALAQMTIWQFMVARCAKQL
jgi:hypothetical protein